MSTMLPTPPPAVNFISYKVATIKADDHRGS